MKSDSDIPKANRVFVNRNLKMESTKAIGFDMDHTLARYNKENIENLAFKTTLSKLVSNSGYDREILELPFKAHMGIRGLVIDSELGYVLKTDKYKYVQVAYFGETLVGREKRKEIYRNVKVDLSDPRFYSIDTLFALPECALWMQIIEFFKGKDKEINYKKLWEEIRKCIDEGHRDGSIKSEILANVGKYIIFDSQLPRFLHDLKEHGKILFLLTNSEFYYTVKVMEFILPFEAETGMAWHDYFDWIIVRCGKPEFFYEGKELERIPIGDENIRYKDILNQNNVFRFGNYRSLQELLKCNGDQICYIGDHTFGDIMKSKKQCGWRTIMIIEELEHEITTELKLEGMKNKLQTCFKLISDLMSRSEKIIRDIDKIHNRKLGEFKKYEPQGFKTLDCELKTLLDSLMTCEAEISKNLSIIQEIELDINQAFNRYWGKVFKTGEELSRFGDQVEDFACVYTYKVSNLTLYPVNYYFHSKRDKMSHEMD
ncbi:HAD-IG family 5'-nucleotidase [Candidatus Riflebacteria bacterium]